MKVDLKMVERRVVIAGGFGLPDRNASAQRAVGLAKLFTAIGRTPLILGKFERIPSGSDGAHVMVIDGIEMRDIRKPFATTSESDYVRQSSGILAVLDHIGARNIDLIILYNFPVRGICAVRKICRRLSLPLALDLSEWYGWEGSKILRNIIRVMSSEARMRLLSRKVGNVICTSTVMARYLCVRNTLVLPFVVDPTLNRWKSPKRLSPPSNWPRRLIYVGSPGVGMQKDRLPEIVCALAALPADIPFRFDIYGMTEEDFKSTCPNIDLCRDREGKEILFHGRVSHEEALKELAKAHFSVFLRRPNRVANMGFPTKYMEATTLGVPVITNATSDISTYLEHGRNGILARSEAVSDMTEALLAGLSMDDVNYQMMREEQRMRNPFSVENWTQQADSFLTKASETSKENRIE